MTAGSKCIFKPRKFSSADAHTFLSKQSFLADSASHGPPYGATELTKNDKYCVSRLPALPPMLSDHMGDSAAFPLNGYTDNATKCALVVNETAINVWPYSSIDDTPITFEFPLSRTSEDALQLAILAQPTPGTTLDPGLAIINSVSGHVCFYESVQYAPALGMINSKTIETVVAILAAQGEYITLAENVEPAGIAVATSWKRVVLIILRDYKGAPQLSSLELTKPSAANRFFSAWLGASSSDEITDEIVSIKSGTVSQNGTTQDIIVQDAAGTFKKFVYVVSASGAPFVNHRKTVLYRLLSYLEKNIDGLIPGTVLDTKFLDLWPLVQDAGVSADIYVSLVAVQSSMHGVEEWKLLLLKLKINESGVLVLSSHQLPNVEQGVAANLTESRPRLFIPKPGNTVFVAIGNSVVLSDLNAVSARSNTPEFQYYEPKWEDVVNFKSAVQIVGFGYEDKFSTLVNSALVFITAEHGVVRIERFANSSSSSNIVSDDTDPSDPVSLLRSHILQAVFYSESSFVDFNVGTGVPHEIIGPAVNAVVLEILDSTSPYLPPNYASTRDLFALRLRLLKTLIEYSRVNFSDALYAVLPVIVEALEKLDVASNLWNILDSDTAEAPRLRTMFKRIIKHTDTGEKSASHDTIRAFFTHHVGKILLVLTDLVDVVFASDVPLNLLVQLLVSTLHDAVYKNEVAFIFGISEIPPVRLWLFDTSLLVKAEEVYTQAFCTKNDTFQVLDTQASRTELIHFTETLYFLVTSAIHYMQQVNDDQLHEYVQWYNKRKGAWVDALLVRGLAKEAMAIAQKYHDFYSVAHVLEKAREQSSQEYVFDKTDFFMNLYGYDFAAKLFDYYILKSHFHRILEDCKPYASFLEQYFEENPEKASKVSWIYYIQARDFERASSVLIALSPDKESDNQENKAFHYSLAKLTAIAAKAEGPTGMGDTSKYDEIAVEAESNLVVIRVQNKLHECISWFVEGKKELMTVDFFVDNLANPQLLSTNVMEEIEPFFQRFVDQKALEKSQLIALLTSANPTSRFVHVFAEALKVAALIDNDSVFTEQASAVWKKLICATDDWTQISATEENSDKVNKMRVRETVMFRTLKVVQDNKEIMKVLDGVLKETHEDHMTDGGPWDAKLQELVKSCDIEMWITTVRNEARQISVSSVFF